MTPMSVGMLSILLFQANLLSFALLPACLSVHDTLDAYILEKYLPNQPDYNGNSGQPEETGAPGTASIRARDQGTRLLRQAHQHAVFVAPVGA